MAQVVFVGTPTHRLNGNGKMSPSMVLPVFRAVAADWGVEVHAYENVDAVPVEGHAGAVVVLIYNEESIQDERYHREVLRTEAAARGAMGARHVVHELESGRTIGDKRATHLVLLQHGVMVPPEVSDTSTPTFSAAVLGSGLPVHVVAAGALDPARHNTRFIDTVRTFRGRSYHVCLRAMAVEGTLVATYVRARDVAEGSASVHTSNTPKDAELLNWLYSTIVLPRQGEIEAICRGVARAFGLGFYSHDILPEADTGQLYVCETGYKVDEATMRTHLAQIGPLLGWSALWNDVDTVKTAHAFFHACRKRGLI